MQSISINYDLIKKTKANKNFLGGLLFIFLIYPFAAFLIALYHYTKKESYLIFVLFTGLYGYFMVADSPGLDLYRILQSPDAYAQLPTGEIFNAIRGIYSDDPEASVDIYRDAVTFIVSRFTTNGNVLTLVFALVYGIVFLKSISIFFEKYRNKGFYSGIILLSFAFIFSMDMVAGVRYATAAYVFFAGAVKLIETSEKKYLWLVLAAPLIHFSYLLPVAVVGLFFLFRRSPLVIYGILAASFILPEFLSTQINQLSMIIGGAIEQRVNLYLLEQEQGLVSEARLVWFVRFREEGIFFFSILVLAVSRLKRWKLHHTSISESLFYFSLMILTLTNFMAPIPQAGYRLQFVFAMFAIYYLYVLFANNPQNIRVKRLALLAFPAFFFQIIFGLRSILATSSPMLYIGNVFTSFITEFNQSMWSMLFNQ